MRQPVAGSRGDLLRKYFRVGLVEIAPRGLLGLHMTGEFRLAALHQFPFGPTLTVHGFVARIHVVVREVISAYLILGNRRGSRAPEEGGSPWQGLHQASAVELSHVGHKANVNATNGE